MNSETAPEDKIIISIDTITALAIIKGFFETTTAVRIESKEKTIEIKSRNVKVNFWDWSDQLSMENTFQYFFLPFNIFIHNNSLDIFFILKD